MARLCDDLVLYGYDDWFLPSIFELNEMYVKLHLKGIGGFGSGHYWSSTEVNTNSAWAQHFGTGVQNAFGKQTNTLFRAVKEF